MRLDMQIDNKKKTKQNETTRNSNNDRNSEIIQKL